ncbi:hypothetical protein BCA33_11635 [Marinobacter sp. AC-23]|nr:hypothetical protein BCA33_11635 [Marinobacter sp. AC-23]
MSPYFIPTKTGVEIFRDLERRGVQVRVLTNSLEANDVAMIHAGYAKYRKPLLVELSKLLRALLTRVSATLKSVVILVAT